MLLSFAGSFIVSCPSVVPRPFSLQSSHPDPALHAPISVGPAKKKKKDMGGNGSMFLMAGVMALVVLLFAGPRMTCAGGSPNVMLNPVGILNAFFAQAAGGILLIAFVSLRLVDQGGDAEALVDNAPARSLVVRIWWGTEKEKKRVTERQRKRERERERHTHTHTHTHTQRLVDTTHTHTEDTHTYTRTCTHAVCTSLQAAVNVCVGMAFSCATALGVHSWFVADWAHLPPFFTIRLATCSALAGMVRPSA